MRTIRYLNITTATTICCTVDPRLSSYIYNRTARFVVLYFSMFMCYTGVCSVVLPTQCHFVEGDYPEASAQDVSKLEPLENGGNFGMYCGSCFHTSYTATYPFYLP